jgi:cadmium resistance protein CadD (predicted permease)
MSDLVSAITTGITAFTATNIDDIVMGIFIFQQSKYLDTINYTMSLRME